MKENIVPLLLIVGLIGVGAKFFSDHPEKMTEFIEKIFPPPPNQEPKTLEEKRARSTVLITGVSGTSYGSGVIITSQGKYYVLTNRHVIGTPPGPQNKYEVKNYQQKVYQVITAENYDSLVKNEKLDLALIELPTPSQEQYTAAKLSTGLYDGMDIIISGWPQCPQPQYFPTKGKISKQLLDENDIEKLLSKQDSYREEKDKNYQDGYRVNYTNETLSGMSGGPVFNSDGNVVAIHGMAGVVKDPALKNCQSLNKEGTGNNWGIPISLFLNSNLAQGKKFEITESPHPPGTPTPPPQPPSPPSNKEDMFLCTDKDKEEGVCQ